MERARVIIADMAYGGEGVGRLVDGSVVFVPFTAIGDDVEVEIVERKPTFCRGRALTVLHSGAGRTVPLCKHYGRCGGCVYQHLEYQMEISCKSKQFKDLMKRVGKFETFPELESVNPSPQEYGYRNKLRLEPSERVLEANGYFLAYGYCERDNETFFMVKSCPLAQDALNKLLPKAIRSDLGRQNAKRKAPYPLTLRVTSSGDCAYYFGQAPAKMTWLNETLLDKSYKVPVGGFWQVNPPVAEKLLATVKSWCTELPATELLDIYGGAGTFTMQLGDKFQKRTLIESDKPAVDAANFSFQAAGLAVTLWTGPAEEFLEAADGPLSETNLDEALAIIDPPRTGCMPKAIAALRDRPPKYLIYVSCNAATLARDLKALCADGLYVPQRCAMFDMFPRTAHFETVVLLSKLSNTKHHVEVEFNLDEMDLTSAESKATYDEIREYVMAQTGLHVTNLNIAQIKRKCGIIERENYNLPKSEDSRQPNCTKEKEAAIKEALKHFGMI